MEITYRSTRADKWRCNLSMLVRNPGILVLALIWGCMGGFFAQSIYHTLNQAILIGILVALGSIGLQFLLLALLISASIRPDGKGIECTSSIDSYGFTEQDGPKKVSKAWSQVTSIKMVDEDIYIKYGSGGAYIPGSAWANRQDCISFYDTAIKARDDAKQGRMPNVPNTVLQGHIERVESAESQVGVQPITRRLTPEQLVKQQKSQIVVGVIIICFFLWLTVSSGLSWQRDLKLVHDYSLAPGCTTTADPHSTYPPCTYEKDTVVNKIVETHSKGGDDYYLELSRPVGPNKEVMVDYDFYQDINRGIQITAQYWQNHVTRVDYGTQTTLTSRTPSRMVGKDRFIFYGGLLLLVTMSYTTIKRRRMMNKGIQY